MRSNGATTAASEWKAGWQVVVASFLGTYLCVTFLYSFGFFIRPLEETFGWSRSGITTGITIVTIIGALTHPIAGMLVDRFGAWRVAVPSVIFYSSAVALLATTGPSLTSWWLRCALVGFAYGCSASFIWLTATVARFQNARGMAIAVVQLGPATAMTTLPLIVGFLLGHVGWRGALVWLAIGGFAIVLPAAVFLLRPPKAGPVQDAPAIVQPGATFAEILADARFWRLVCAAACTTFGVNGLSLHFVPLLTDADVARSTALGVASLIGIGSLIGRFGCGLLLDRLPGNLIAGVAFCLPILPCLMLLFELHSVFSLSVIALMLGLTLGTEVDCIAYILARIFGLRRYATAIAVLAGAMSFGSGVGPLVGAFINDGFGSYNWFLIIEMVIFISGAAMIWSVGNRAYAPVPGKSGTESGAPEPDAPSNSAADQ